MKIKTLNRDMVEEVTGYRPFTTFFEDFSVAEAFGTDADHWACDNLQGEELSYFYKTTD